MIKGDAGSSVVLHSGRSELQVCATGTAAGNHGIVLKQFAAVGLRDWEKLRDLMQHPGQRAVLCVQCSVHSVLGIKYG